MSERVDLNKLENHLQILESSSPSYPLMMSLDISAEILLDEEKKKKTIGEWRSAVDEFYEEARKIEGLKVIESHLLDRTKLNMDMSAYGLDGNRLEKLLMEKGIFVELVTGNILMGMTGIGTTRRHVERLLDALREIAGSHRLQETAERPEEHPGILTVRLERTAVPSEMAARPLNECAGLTAAASIIPYPPGIPIACPGEILTEEIISYVAKLRSLGEKVIGVSPEGEILVGK